MKNQHIIILLPSPLILARTYSRLICELEKEFLVLIAELPESGQHYHRHKVWNEREYAQWLADWLELRKIHKPILLGHSNSGAVVLECARRWPSRIRGIVLADTIGVKKQNPFSVALGRAADGLMELGFSLRAAPHLISNFIRHPKNMFNQVRAASRIDFSDQLKTIKVPALVAWGKFDFTMSLSLGRRLQQALPMASIYTSSVGCHDWPLTQSIEFVAAVKAWTRTLGELPQSKPGWMNSRSISVS
jgi:pimeloyl-ACP methyl ester carboxylesterase